MCAIGAHLRHVCKSCGNLTQQLSIRLFGIREHEARTRPERMDHAGVQFTGFPGRGDERQGQRSPTCRGRESDVSAMPV